MCEVAYSLQPNGLYAKLGNGIIVELNTPLPDGVLSFLAWGAAVAATDYANGLNPLVRECFAMTPPGQHHHIYDYIILLMWGEWLGVDL